MGTRPPRTRSSPLYQDTITQLQRTLAEFEQTGVYDADSTYQACDQVMELDVKFDLD